MTATKKASARKPRILPDLDAAKRIAELEAQLAEAEAKAVKKLVVKVSPKGAVQLNGLRQFPVTFYKGKWETIFENTEVIQKFIKENEASLSVKG